MKLIQRLAMVLAGAALALPVLAVPVVYHANLSGAAEAPPNASPGTGSTVVTVDAAANTMRVQVDFSGLTAPNTAAHIHCCTAVPGVGNVAVASSVPTFTGFPTGTTAGTYDHLFDMTLTSSFRAGFITESGGTASTAFNALLAGLGAGRAYLNIHTSAFPGGEIRGFLLVPEPQTYALMLAGVTGLWFASRRRRIH